MLAGEISSGEMLILLANHFDRVEFLVQNVAGQKDLRKGASAQEALAFFGLRSDKVVKLHVQLRLISLHYYNFI